MTNDNLEAEHHEVDGSLKQELYNLSHAKFIIFWRSLKNPINISKDLAIDFFQAGFMDGAVEGAKIARNIIDTHLDKYKK